MPRFWWLLKASEEAVGPLSGVTLVQLDLFNPKDKCLVVDWGKLGKWAVGTAASVRGSLWRFVLPCDCVTLNKNVGKMPSVQFRKSQGIRHLNLQNCSKARVSLSPGKRSRLECLPKKEVSGAEMAGLAFRLRARPHLPELSAEAPAPATQGESWCLRDSATCSQIKEGNGSWGDAGYIHG